MSRETPAFSIETLRPRDLPSALAIQSESYPAFLIEEAAPFLSRLTLADSYCLAALREGPREQAILGYLLAHGWRGESPPPVGAVLADGGPREVLFIHDLAVSSSGRGLGVGRSLVMRVFELAARDGIRSAELIAVEGAADYWRALGFVEDAVSPGLAAKVATYGDRARWMTRAIPG
ncbi:GNAT family N-acetyltransferase [Sphingobium lignivorans]|uniref:Ribosomal protein S18 acetylase RimI-like enzyme n=1 Tax=Sphingobium lignivorans TaxID=2735886 RepID=A0ABR6NKZ1_9SPHN|nr:GNAT family N-acetyltransferase [Sphingobium lignivorans]MBB5987946.1 ribosomal protein S18 acetylase RimI-like enzyme [Sphingobium lignivorans]